MQDECPHEDMEFIGEDRGRNRYLRCRQCGAVIVTDGKTAWRIPHSNSK